MYCYKIEPHNGYSGGCAIVAAHNVDEAIKTFCKDEYNDYEYDMFHCTCNVVNGLHYDSETPKIVFNHIYSE